MTNVATTLLDFILNLLNDPEAMAAYQADREGALTAAGLGGCGDEVDTALTTAGAGTSLYYAHAPATFHSSGWSDDRDVFVTRVSDDDGIDDSFNRIEDSFNTTVTNTTINDNDFTNNGVIIDGNGNRVENTVNDNDTTTTNVNSNNATVEGDVVEGDVIEESGPGSVVVGDQSTGDVEDSIIDNDDVTQEGLLNVNDVLSPNLNVAPDVAILSEVNSGE